MRVWIDGQCLQTASRMRGIGRYVRELIASISVNCPEVEMLISFNAALAEEAVVAREVMSQYVPRENIGVWQGVAEPGEAKFGYKEAYRLSELALAHHVALLAPDIALSASPFEGEFDPAVPLLTTPGGAVPLAGIFYDAIPYRFANAYLKTRRQHRFYERRLKALGSFDLLLAISDFANREAQELIPTVSDVATIDAGVPEELVVAIGDASPDPLIAALPSPVLTYVGSLDWRKNVPAVIDAIDLLPGDLRQALQFVVAGDAPAHLVMALRERWDRAGMPTGNLHTLGHVSTSRLVALYRKSDAVIQPSLMEGFGLTAIEAIFCGAPVVASAAGAIPEVVKDKRALFDPTNLDDIATHIARVIGDRAFARSLVEGSRDQVAVFTWKRTAERAVEALTRSVRNARIQAAPLSLAEVRMKTAESVGTLALQPKRIANVLAAAEPTPRSRRLLIDVTELARIDLGTGIQRVVKNISRRLQGQALGGEGPPVSLVRCNSPSGFRPATLDRVDGAEGAENVKTVPPRIIFNPDDIVLMLDSSWQYHRRQGRALREAQLRGAEVVSTLYDLVPVYFPGFCDPGMPPVFSAWLRQALDYSSGFVCISRAVADELLALLRQIDFPRSMKVGYWHLGADFADRMEAAPEKSQIPMFLTVGTIEPRKGHRIIVDAFTRLWSEGVEAELVIVGKRGWGTDHLQRTILSHSEFGSRLKWLEKVDDLALLQLYASCDALISASHAEGFGLPIVEAGLQGKPVIASRIAVFEEVGHASSGTSYFDVGSSESLAMAIRTFLDTNQSASVPSRESRRWISWDESAVRLREIVTTGDWYRVYEPGPGPTFTSGIGRVAMTRALSPGERRYQVELVEGPIRSRSDKLRFIVRANNLSDVTWSSSGPDERDDLGIVLAYRLIGDDGGRIDDPGTPTRIPFVLPPGDSLVAAVEVDLKWRERGARFIDLCVSQRGAGEWPTALRLPFASGAVD
jgi:glycosyltransferase involved in cell wall biosynthesis